MVTERCRRLQNVMFSVGMLCSLWAWSVFGAVDACSMGFDGVCVLGVHIFMKLDFSFSIKVLFVWGLTLGFFVLFQGCPSFPA